MTMITVAALDIVVTLWRAASFLIPLSNCGQSAAEKLWSHSSSELKVNKSLLHFIYHVPIRMHTCNRRKSCEFFELKIDSFILLNFSKGWGWCLNDQPAIDLQPKLPKRMLPGQRFDADAQCKMYFGLNSTICSGTEVKTSLPMNLIHTV